MEESARNGRMYQPGEGLLRNEIEGPRIDRRAGDELDRRQPGDSRPEDLRRTVVRRQVSLLFDRAHLRGGVTQPLTGGNPRPGRANRKPWRAWAPSDTTQSRSFTVSIPSATRRICRSFASDAIAPTSFCLIGEASMPRTSDMSALTTSGSNAAKLERPAYP